MHENKFTMPALHCFNAGIVNFKCLEHFKYKCSRMLFGLGERDRLGRTRRRLADETFHGYVFI